MQPSHFDSKWWVASVAAPVEDRVSKHVYQGWAPCMFWCAERMHKDNWRYISEGVFEFRRSEDHLMFILKWS